MAAIATLRDSLKRRAKIQASENFTDSDLEGHLTDALREHNPSYEFGVLPVAEEEPVILLAWIRVCNSRAAQWAQAANTGGQATMQQDNETPFSKNLKLAKFLREQYTALVVSLGISSRFSGISVSTVTAQDGWVEAEVPLALSRTPPVPTLSLAAGESKAVGTTYIIKWTVERYENFQEWRLFHMVTENVSTDTLRHAWNQDSDSGTPQLNNLADLLKTISDQQISTLKAVNVDKTKRNLFLLVAVSRSGLFSYSNELELKNA